MVSLSLPRSFARQLVGGAKGEGGRRVWWLWTEFCWLCWNAGRANQNAEWVWYVILSHDFCIERAIGLMVDMARSVKVDKLSTSKAVSSVGL